MMNEWPLVSVIVPLYNTQDYAEECIRSVLGQTYGDFELICINDGSTDATRDVALRAMGEDARARLIDEENQGLSGARNTGLDMAAGKYVFFLDSDDMIAPNALEALVGAAKRFDAQVVSSVCGEDAELKACIERGENVGPPVFEAATLDDFYLQAHITNHSCGKLFARSLFEEPRLRFPLRRSYEDVATTYLLMERAAQIAYTDSILYYYRQNDAGITQTFTERNVYGLLAAYEEMRDHFFEKGPTRTQRFYLLTVLHTLLRLINMTPRTEELTRVRKRAEKEFDELFSFDALDFKRSRWFSSKLLIRRLRIGKSLLMRLAK